MITIIGTAHISQESIEEVRDKILELKPDIVAVELCESRYRGLVEKKDIPIFDLIKSKNSTLLLANILLSFLQRRLGEEVGVKPGKEMLVALDTAKELGVESALIDRDIKITLSRTLGKMDFIEKIRVVKEMLLTFGVSSEDIEREIMELKKEANISNVLENFRTISPNLYEVLVNERDAFMAYELLKLSQTYENIIAVMGAGHRKGVEYYLQNPEEIPDIKTLLEIPRKRFSILKVLKFGIPAVIIGIFLLAFYRGIGLEQPIAKWILYHAVPTFFAVLLVGGSIISALVGMTASPLTSLNPMLAAGWFAGVTEIKVRKVTVGDVRAVFKTTNYAELYRNKAFKVLLVTAVANIGSSLGTLVSIPKVILPLVKSIFG
jgi:pheromone shutdown-related protein TraB